MSRFALRHQFLNLLAGAFVWCLSSHVCADPAPSSSGHSVTSSKEKTVSSNSSSLKDCKREQLAPVAEFLHRVAKDNIKTTGFVELKDVGDARAREWLQQLALGSSAKVRIQKAGNEGTLQIQMSSTEAIEMRMMGSMMVVDELKLKDGKWVKNPVCLIGGFSAGAQSAPKKDTAKPHESWSESFGKAIAGLFKSYGSCECTFSYIDLKNMGAVGDAARKKFTVTTSCSEEASTCECREGPSLFFTGGLRGHAQCGSKMDYRDVHPAADLRVDSKRRIP